MNSRGLNRLHFKFQTVKYRLVTWDTISVSRKKIEFFKDRDLIENSSLKKLRHPHCR